MEIDAVFGQSPKKSLDHFLQVSDDTLHKLGLAPISAGLQPHLRVSAFYPKQPTHVPGMLRGTAFGIR